jgi:hypothetical protein
MNLHPRFSPFPLYFPYMIHTKYDTFSNTNIDTLAHRKFIKHALSIHTCSTMTHPQKSRLTKSEGAYCISLAAHVTNPQFCQRTRPCTRLRDVVVHVKRRGAKKLSRRTRLVRNILWFSALVFPVKCRLTTFPCLAGAI